MRFPEWAKNAVIYEVNIRQYTPEGTLNAFATHLPRLKEMGVDILWLMPIFPISEVKRKGTLGSYYAVSDYTKVNPEFGTLDDAKALIEAIHSHDMKIILDWVPNHTGWDHHWIDSNPDYYRKNAEGEVTDPLDWSGVPLGWEDVADLNYDSAEMRLAKIKDLLFWIEDYGIDGYRMDIAWRVQLDFWKQASEALVAVKPDLFMVAEADSGDQIYHGYFQACYGWKLHHIMNEVANGHKNAHNIYDWYYNERKHILDGRIMQFITNHDENSWSGSEYERMGEAVDCLAILAMTIDGIPLVYNGQEEPLTKRLAFFEKDDIGFGKYDKQDFYKKLIHLKHTQESIWNADYGVELQKIAEDEFIIAYKREKGDSKVVVILNLSNHSRFITLWEDVIGLQELFTGEVSDLHAGQNLPLAPYHYLVYHSE